MGDHPKDGPPGGGRTPGPAPGPPPPAQPAPRSALPRPGGALPRPGGALPRPVVKQTLMGGSGTPAYPAQYPPVPPGPSWPGALRDGSGPKGPEHPPDARPGSTQPEAHDTTPDGGPHGTDPAPDTSRSGSAAAHMGGTPRRAGKSPF